MIVSQTEPTLATFSQKHQNIWLFKYTIYSYLKIFTPFCKMQIVNCTRLVSLVQNFTSYRLIYPIIIKDIDFAKALPTISSFDNVIIKLDCFNYETIAMKNNKSNTII